MVCIGCMVMYRSIWCWLGVYTLGIYGVVYSTIIIGMFRYIIIIIYEVPTLVRSDRWPKKSRDQSQTSQSQDEHNLVPKTSGSLTLSGAEWQSKSLTSISANFATLFSMSSLAFSLLPFSSNCTENCYCQEPCYCANSYTIDTRVRISEKGLAISELLRASVSKWG